GSALGHQHHAARRHRAGAAHHLHGADAADGEGDLGPRAGDGGAPQPPPPEEKGDQFIFRVDDKGQFFINSEQLTDENAADRLKVYYRLAKANEAKNGPPVIFFEADDKTKYLRAVKGLDKIKDSSSGWTIGMMTEKIGAPGAPAAPEAPAAPG